MPREILTPMETSHILSQGGLHLIGISNEMGHTEIVYEITGGENGLRCDFCGHSAMFVHHTKDHMAQNFVALTCTDCAPRGYENMSQQRGGG